MRVFVLGAGASRHAGYPLAAEMDRNLTAWISTLPNGHDYRAYMEQIVEAYSGLDDFEAILADLMTCPPGSPAALFGARRPALLTNLQEAIRDYFDSIRTAPARLYDKLARIVRPGDSVITFNYDLGIERALRTAGLWDIKTGYGFGIEDGELPSPVEVLKLHGSTNWRAVLFGGRRGSFSSGNSLGERPVLFFHADAEYLGYRDFVDPLCSPLGSAASLPAMIMPALPKRFYFETSFGKEWKTFWEGLWQRARRAIDKADELVMIGYSMPTIDVQARAMLLDARNKSVRLSICCGKATARLREEFRDHGFNSSRSVATTFDDFLAAETAGTDIDVGTPSTPPATQPGECEGAAPARATLLPAQRMLIATAKLCADANAIYSEEGTPIQDRETTIEMLRLQLYGKVSHDDIERFVSTLHASGHDEIREVKPMAKSFTLG